MTFRNDLCQSLSCCLARLSWLPRHSRGLQLACCLVVVACAPTVKVATDEPITINLNVNIQHEVRVKVDRDLEDVLSADSGLF